MGTWKFQGDKLKDSHELASVYKPRKRDREREREREAIDYEINKK